MSLLSLRDVRVHFNTSGGVVRAVNGVSLDLAVGETLGLVGESGCGKSTLGKAIMKLVPIAGGEIVIEGVDIAPLNREQLTNMRRKVQMIFQDPYGSLNPRSTVGRSVAQPLVLAGWKADATAERVETLLRWVGLPSDAKQRYPHEFSGGQRQRIGIARALALEPSLLICDEPVSALDVSIQAQVVNVLQELQERMGLAYLFIAHDLAVVRHLSHRVAVMYLGRIVEIAPRDELYRAPLHPYTQALLSAVPVADPVVERARARVVVQGEVPSALNPPSGCRFHTRCPQAMARCRTDDPPLQDMGGGRAVACHLHQVTVSTQLATDAAWTPP